MGPLWYIGLGAGVVVTLLAVYAFVIEPRRLRLEELAIPVPNLPPAFDGLRIAHLTDLHVGALRLSHRLTSKAVELAIGAQPDIVVLTGDLVDRDPHARRAVELLQPLDAPLGVWAVLGNHDYNWTAWARARQLPVEALSDECWANLLDEAGVTLLANESVAIERNGERLWLAGCGDPYCYRDDLDRTLREVRDGELCVLLCHSPDIVDHPLASRPALILCGHTHGGQVRLPLIGPIYAPCRDVRERARGLTRIAGVPVYSNRGVGGSKVPRFHCHPEVALITLRRAPEE
ncbi:MAG: metallophosphoesterase [Armatimonadota bacterium]